MRKNLLLVLSGIGLFAMTGTASAGANWEIRAQVPFSFEVGHTSLPAGAYTIAPMGILEPSVFVIRRAGDGAAVEFLVNDMTPEKQLASAALTFDRYGKEEFLHTIVVPDGRAVELPISSSESRAEKDAASAAERHALAVEHDSLKKVGARH